MSSSKMTEEEDDVEMLRRAALKTMSRFKDKPKAAESTGRSQQNIRTNNAIKANNKVYYSNNSHRNGSTRSNLIVLTKTDTELSNSQTDSQFKRFTKIIDKTSDSSEKYKRVLPGRFSRLERDDEDSDEDTDECSDDYNVDDNQLTTISAFNETPDQQKDQDFNSNEMISSQPITDLIDCNDSQNIIKDSKNDIIDEIVEDLTTNCTSSDAIISCHNSSDFERKETIKLNSNTVSKSEAFERRKQKFGQTMSEEKVNSSTDSLNTRNQRSSIKNRLSVKSKQKNSNKTNERNYTKSISDKEVVSSHRHRPNSRAETLDSNDELDNCQHSSKKRLRSLVVMK